VIAEADLFDASLVDADLVGANAQYAYMLWADLTGANLEGASLHGAYLGRAKLNGARVHRADFSGASVMWADLSDLECWEKIADVTGLNVFEVKNPPEGFVEWALEHGAVSIPHKEWKAMAMAARVDEWDDH
jgi:uncharacterized protein YjbI with pentapeptide repeats